LRIVQFTVEMNEPLKNSNHVIETQAIIVIKMCKQVKQ